MKLIDKFNNINKIKVKMIIILIPFILIIMIAFLIIFKDLIVLKSSYDILSTSKVPQLNIVSDVKYKTSKGHLFFEEIMSGDTGENINEIYDLWISAKNDIGKINESNHLSKEHIETSEKIKNNLYLFLKTGKERYKNLKQALPGSNADQKFDAIYDQIIEDLEIFQGYISNDVTKYTNIVNERFKSVLITLFISFLVIIMYVIFVILIFSSSIILPIIKITKTTELFTKDYNVNEINIDSKDEIGILASKINNMMNKISDSNNKLIEEKNSISKKVAEAVKESEERLNEITEVTSKLVQANEESEKQRKIIEDNQIRLKNQISRLIDITNQVAAGNLSIQIEDNIEDNETRQLSQSLNLMIKDLNNIVNLVVTSVNDVYVISEDINTNSRKLENVANIQLKSIEKMIFSVQEISAAVSENTNIIFTADNFTNEVVETVKDGINQITNIINSISKISDFINETNKNFNRLSLNSEKIHSFTQIIADIATQTNLLSLNASIEAARAGDAGRGFAVVAEEIRKLSDKTSKSANEIKNINEIIFSDTKILTSSIKDGSKDVNSIINIANSSKDNLDMITNKVNTLKDTMNEISAFSEEQNISISQALENIN
ncbi:MAG: methyl-accepting chemotaxis protein [Candidatus Sericytochromatia bacterium]